MKDFIVVLAGILLVIGIIALAISWRLYVCEGAEHYWLCFFAR